MNLSQCNRAEGTIKQRAFVRHLFDTDNPKTFGNGTQSAKFAGYKGNSKYLSVVAWQNIRKSSVIALAEDLVNSTLSTEDIEREISRVAQANTPITESSKMKALDLLTKIKGMVTQKVETVDLTEKNSTEQAILRAISKSAKSDQISESVAAIALFTCAAEDDEPSALKDPGNYGPFRADIEAHLANKTAEPEQIDGNM